MHTNDPEQAEKLKNPQNFGILAQWVNSKCQSYMGSNLERKCHVKYL